MSLEKLKMHVKHETLEEYQQQELARLHESDLAENGLYQLMMRTENFTSPALRAPVFVKNIDSQLARLSFGVVYTDRDLRPVVKRPHQSTLNDRYWQPDRPLPLSTNGVRGLARTGFLLPYDPELDNEFLQLSESLSLASSR